MQGHEMSRGKLFFIFNPHSGRERIRGSLTDIVDILCKSGFEVSIYATQCQGDAEVKALAEGGSRDLIVCAGGDGTLDEVVSGLMRGGHHVPVGYIPAGTSNDFAASLQLSQNMKENARIAVTGHPFACDIGRFNDGYFVYVAAFGLFTEASYHTSQEMKNIFGHAAYVLEGMRQLADVPSYFVQVDYDGNRIFDEFIYGMVTNSVSVGGFRGLINHPVDLDDGKFEVVLVRRPRNPREFNEIISYLTGRVKQSDMIYAFKSGQIHFRCGQSISWTLDGEFGGQLREAVVKNLPRALNIMLRGKSLGREEERRNNI